MHNQQINEQINEIDKQIEELQVKKGLLIKQRDRKHEDPDVDRYLNTYYGNALLKSHSLDEVGIWEVLGEDPNCDVGGSHHMPHLGNFEGRLEDVIKAAVNLSGFWQWGGGGDIRKTEVVKVKKV